MGFFSELVSGGLGGMLHKKFVTDPRRAKTAMRGQIASANTETQKQKNIAEDERLRRLRLLQGGADSSFQMEQATGRKTLLGQ